jgi:hypothetical protein
MLMITFISELSSRTSIGVSVTKPKFLFRDVNRIH